MISPILALSVAGTVILGSVGEGSVTSSPYQVFGDRQSRVTVIETQSRKVVRTFQMGKGVIRKTLLLDQGRTVVGLQAYHAIFWDLISGQEKGRINQWIYGFSNDEKIFFTQTKDGIFLYSYPQLKQVCNLIKKTESGVVAFDFSPDSRFLAVRFQGGLPATDPSNRGPLVGDISITYMKLYNLEHCQEVENFSSFFPKSGSFSLDSKFYIIKSDTDTPQLSKGEWSFDLSTYRLRKITK